MDPITAAYVQDDADWTITVTGLGKTLTARAPGIIAARDRADQLVEKLVPEQTGRTVVHLLHGSALEFTAAYMQARLARPAPGEEQPEPPAKTEAKKPARKPPAAKPKRTKPVARRTTKPSAEEAKATANSERDVSGALDEATAVANTGQPAS